MSKKHILDSIKRHYGFKSNSEYASFLGIAPQTLSSWYSRDSFDYDLVYAKCVDIDGNWLLSGIGNMYRVSQQKEASIEIVDNEFFLKRFEELVRENQDLKRENEDLKSNPSKLISSAYHNKKEINRIVAEPKPNE